MITENYSTVRQNLKKYCDIVADENEELIVTRKEHKDVVMISLEKYSRLIQIQTMLGEEMIKNESNKNCLWK